MNGLAFIIGCLFLAVGFEQGCRHIAKAIRSALAITGEGPVSPKASDR